LRAGVANSGGMRAPAAMLSAMTTPAAADRTSPPPQERGRWPAVAAVVAFVALVPVAFFYAASGLLVPGPWLYLMWLLLLVLLVVAVLLARRRSYWVLAVPVVGGLAWWAIVSAGEKWLDWTG
jgi:hypothetical protein